jgi:hypothetical protein
VRGKDGAVASELALPNERQTAQRERARFFERAAQPAFERVFHQQVAVRCR